MYSGCVRSEESDRGHHRLECVNHNFLFAIIEITGSLTPKARQGMLAGRFSGARSHQINPISHSYQIDPDLSINNAINH